MKKKGLLMTLIAAAISFTGATASFASAPVIGNIPDVNIGDREDNVGTDNNFFVFTNAFRFDSYVTDSDTTISDLVWSFDEGDHVTSDPAVQTTKYFSVNGKDGIHIGDTAQGVDTSTTGGAHLSPLAANELRQTANGGNVWASLRDVIFSPGAGSPPFPSPTGVVAQAHAAGKFVRFFASDGSNIASRNILVRTIDNTSDTLTGSFSFTVVQDDTLTQTNPANGWDNFPNPVPQTFRSGVDSYDGAQTALLATVTQDNTGSWATFGWITNGGNGTQSLNYAAVGTGKIVRAKFMMYATGQTGAASNQVPDIRMRVAHRFAITASLVVIGSTGSAGDVLDADIQPTKSPAGFTVPSIYKVDLDSPDTPRLVTNAANEAYLRAFEIYDSGSIINGSIGMTEAQIGTYPALAVADAGPTTSPVTASTGLIKSYSGTGAAPGGDFGNGSLTTASAAALLYDSNWAGTVQKYNAGVPDADGSSTNEPRVQSNATGVSLDTLLVESDRFGVVGYDMFGGKDEYPRSLATRQLSPRVESGKLYKVKFHITSTKAANTQPLIRLRARTMSFDWTSFLEINGSAVGGNSSLLVNEFAPGTGNQIPAADRLPGDTTGGWYNVILTSPMDSDIKASQPALAAQDPPGVSTLNSNANSRRDIQLGVDIIDDLSAAQEAAETGQLQLDKVQIQKFNAVN